MYVSACPKLYGEVEYYCVFDFNFLIHTHRTLTIPNCVYRILELYNEFQVILRMNFSNGKFQCEHLISNFVFKMVNF
jgi:hypothetical protein